jgi:predicted flap endonuclease-1-like 5' DNA nuclease
VIEDSVEPSPGSGETEAAKLTNAETEFPASMGKVAPRELAVHDITTFAQVADRTERELLAIHGVGPKAIRILREELRTRGLTFRDE